MPHSMPHNLLLTTALHLLCAGFLQHVYNRSSGSWCELDFELAADTAVYAADKAHWDSADIQVIYFTNVKPWACSSDARPLCDLWETEKAAPVYPVTIVSAYYSGPNKHGDDRYKEWAANFLAHKMPLVFFTDDPSSIPGLEARSKLITQIVVVKKDDFFTSRKIFYWTRQREIDPEDAIHSEHIFKVWLEKTNFVSRAIATNVYDSAYFVWADFGGFRSDIWGNRWTVHAERLHVVNGHGHVVVPGTRMLLMNYPGGHPSKHIAGNIFGGARAAWHLWSHTFYNLIQKEYRKGVFIGDDQIPLGMVAARHPDVVCRLS